MSQFINKDILLQDLERDLLGYQKRLSKEKLPYMKHYYQGKIDYIDQLKCLIELILLKQEEK